MNRARFFFIMAMLVAPCVIRADGGVVRARETQGACVVTIFTPPEVSTVAPADVTVMVQERKTGEVIFDAVVALSFTSPAGARMAMNPGICGPLNNTVILGTAAAFGQSPPIRATHEWATNKLLYGANVILPAVGDWQVRAVVRSGGRDAFVSGVIPVTPSPRRLAGLWPYLAVPPGFIGLFTLNQWLRRRRGD